jgi:hypothetical protein
MNLSPLFRAPWNRKDRGNRKVKPTVRRTPLTVEGLEDRMVLSTMAGLPIPVMQAAPMANVHINSHANPHAGGGSVSVHGNGNANGLVNSSQALQTLETDAATALTTLSSSLTPLIGQLSGVTSGTQLQGILTQIQTSLNTATGSLNGIAQLLPDFAQGNLKQTADTLSQALHDVTGSLNSVSDTLSVISSQAPGLTGTALSDTA